MFTGIISGLGRITEARALGADPSHGKLLTIETPSGYLDDVQLGDSIALNGACMTVTTFDSAADRFTLDISAESLAKTAGLAEPGPVNLEKAMRANDRLGGHLVSGHVGHPLDREAHAVDRDRAFVGDEPGQIARGHDAQLPRFAHGREVADRA